MVLSHFQITPLLKAGRTGSFEIGADLGTDKVIINLEKKGVRFPNGDLLTRKQMAKIVKAKNSCFIFREGCLEKINAFSEMTNRVYSLMPTTGPPTMLVSGVLMHRIKGTDPHKDTLEKIKAVKPVVGRVLDTATGLGYTAIEASKTALSVDTVELDPAAGEVVRRNPWSRPLFDNPNITLHLGDSFDVVDKFEDERFSRVIHDPPVISLAGQLYSIEFYGKLYRVMEPGGKLFHYIANPDTRTGQSITNGVVERLLKAGFKEITHKKSAFGVAAIKP